MMTEVWKTVSDCPAYEISSEGRIRRRLGGKRTRAGRLLKPVAMGKYLKVTLVLDGIRLERRINRLVCEAFHGPAPTPTHEAAHQNGQLHDNRSDNLSWKTKIEIKAGELARGTRTRGERHGSAKLSEADVHKIRSMEGELPNSQIAKLFGVDHCTVTDIFKDRSWAWLEPLPGGHD
ncbi:MAG: hypothetical protein EOS09_16865 [Mesorhizobium sp.]|nr:MAG: hypothetical protein EOS09_16865 [Mesorhizobium sp.]